MSFVDLFPFDGDAVEGFVYCRGRQEVKCAVGYRCVP